MSSSGPTKSKTVKKPNSDSGSRFLLSTPARYKAPARNPAVPKANICQGVQGPWPKRKLLANPLTAPTKNPASGPKATPAIMTMAVMGLK